MVDGIDPVKVGMMWAKVEAMEAEVTELRKDVKTLLELANKSKGGFWMGMVIASSISSLIGFFLHSVSSK
jgi:hypothetical protein